MKYKIFVIVVLFSTSIVPSCKKYLDKKPDKALQVPSTVNDLQALLDHGNFMNYRNPSFDEASGDDYYLLQTDYDARTPEIRNTYTWQNTDYRNYPNDWAAVYDIINVANIVLDHIEKIKPNAQTESSWNNVKGSALFYRAYSYLQGAFIFCNAYDEATAGSDLGMVLRLTSDFNLPSVRANLRETYDRIITDLKQSIPLLPGLPVHVLRPSQSAAYALLARTYLSMRKYDSCYHYANMALQLKSSLLDYNTLNANANRPFNRFNTEVIFHKVVVQPNYSSVSHFYARVDSTLYNSYVEDDLRKICFFKPFPPAGFSFKGMYTTSTTEMYIGLTTDELYLMRAECSARLGGIPAAMEVLNTLLVTRWKTGTFVPFAASSSEEALTIILKERRKQLLFRGLRWMDIKRLNKEGAAIELNRLINGRNYSLPANDNRFALALPADIIDMTAVPQNPY